jgi:hypothetical protein
MAVLRLVRNEPGKAEMFSVELYGRVRHACHVEGLSQREAARRFGIHRGTVRKMLTFSVPPGYRRTKPPTRPKLDAVAALIDAILEADRAAQAAAHRPTDLAAAAGRARLRRRLHDREGLRPRAAAAGAGGVRPARPPARPRVIPYTSRYSRPSHTGGIRCSVGGSVCVRARAAGAPTSSWSRIDQGDCASCRAGCATRRPAPGWTRARRAWRSRRC